MRRIMSAAIAVLLPFAASADCADEIDALFDGPLDAWQRPPHAQLQTTHEADGSVSAVTDNLVETPLRSMGGVRDSGFFAIVIDRRMWQAAGPEGPFSFVGEVLPEDREARQRQLEADRRANATEQECFGEVTLEDGRTAMKYAFRSRSNPDPSGVWTGAHHTIFVEPSGARVIRWEFRDNMAHYAPEPDDKTIVTEFDYSVPVTIEAPEE